MSKLGDKDFEKYLEENKGLQATIDLAESVMELLTENMKLRIKINKAIEYCKNNLFVDSQFIYELLEILGNKENGGEE